MANFAWRFVRKLYLLGGSGGIATKLYNMLRQKSASPSSLFITILGSGLKIDYEDTSAIYLVEHPLVARILANRGLPVFYIHGEIAAPEECVIPGITKCFVPLELTKERMVRCGAAPESIIVTGLVIEPELVSTAENNYNLRLARLNSNEPLTVAFFISQAYPKPHINKIMAAIESVIEKGMKAIVFTGTEPKKAQQMKNRLDLIRERNPKFNAENLKIIISNSRPAENQKTAELMSEIDIIVAASHERTNWAVGLGLPIFLLFPLIGTYAKQNFDFAFDRGVALPIPKIEDARNLDDRLNNLRELNILKEMMQSGFTTYNLDGARFIADYIINSF
jgi:organic radical activating enzyme